MSDSDDNIFQVARKPTNNLAQQRKIMATTFISEAPQPKQDESDVESRHNEKIEVEEVDADALARRLRMRQMRQMEEEQIANTKDAADTKKEKKEKKHKKAKHKQKKIIRDSNVQVVDELKDQVEEDDGDQEEPQRNITLLKPVYISRSEREQTNSRFEEDQRIQKEKERNIERQKIEAKMLLVQSYQTMEMADDLSENEGKLQMPNDDDEETQDSHEVYKQVQQRNLDDQKGTMMRERSWRKKRLKQREEGTLQMNREQRKTLNQGPIRRKFKRKLNWSICRNITIKECISKMLKMKFCKEIMICQLGKIYGYQIDNQTKDKSVLPKILQKRRGQFGKRGQSKYTHLTDQDTTNYDPDYQADENIRQKFFMKQAGNRSQNSFDQFFTKRR